MTNHMIKLGGKKTASFIRKEILGESLSEYGVTGDLIVKVGLEKTAFKCHQIILASTSEFLKIVLESVHPAKIPVLILPDVSPAIFEYILYFVYNGKMSIPLTKYAEFVDVCRYLKLKGLNEAINNESSNDENFIPLHDDSVSIDEANFLLDNILKRSNTRSQDEQLDEAELNTVDIKQEFENLNTDSPNEYSDKEDIIEPKENKNRVKKVKITNKRFLKQCVQSVYDRIRKKPEKSVAEIVNATILKNKNKGKLSAVEHQCGFCGEWIRFKYKKGKPFGLFSEKLRTHLYKMHKIKVPKRKPKTNVLKM